MARDQDPVAWLENKFGSASSDGWSGREVFSLLNPERLESIINCFIDLPSHIKLRLLLSIFHLSRKNIALWKPQLIELLQIASQDIDEWVQCTAELLKDYPESPNISFVPSCSDSFFDKTYSELVTLAKRHKKSQLRPLDFCCSSIQSTSKSADPSRSFFTQRNNPRSSTIRAEMLQRSKRISVDGCGLVSAHPIKSRDMTRKLDVDTPLRGLPTPNAAKTSGGFTASKTFSRPAPPKKEGGVKFIELDETPQALKKRRQLDNAALKANRAAKAGRKSQSRRSEDISDHEQEIQSNAPFDFNHTDTDADAFLEPSVSVRQESVIQERLEPVIPAQAFIPATTPTVLPPPQQSAPPYVLSPDANHVPAPPMSFYGSGNSSQQSFGNHYSDSSANVSAGMGFYSSVSDDSAKPQSTLGEQQPFASSNPGTFVLSQEVVANAKELFANANRLSRPEKALILGFMAGKRENPCPHMGPVLTVRLNESSRSDVHTGMPVVEETYFQMNYESGQWKTLCRSRPL